MAPVIAPTAATPPPAAESSLSAPAKRRQIHIGLHFACGVRAEPALGIWEDSRDSTSTPRVSVSLWYGWAPLRGSPLQSPWQWHAGHPWAQRALRSWPRTEKESGGGCADRGCTQCLGSAVLGPARCSRADRRSSRRLMLWRHVWCLGLLLAASECRAAGGAEPSYTLHSEAEFVQLMVRRHACPASPKAVDASVGLAGGRRGGQADG